MVADGVAGGGYGAGDGWALADEVSDHEEGGADVVAGEKFEERIGGNVVGAVVVGERYFVGVAAGDDGVAEELRTWAEGRVG